MTDDLIKRLRDRTFLTGSLEELAANRIEQLEAACWRMKEDRDRAIGWRDHDTTRAETAETKLAKAMEAIKEVQATVASSKVPIAGLIRHQCKVALAELEEEE
jgi:hypothetical protein